MRLDDIYRTHPLQQRTILARLQRQGFSGALDETDLAHDPETEITDQNHIGGADFVVELAEAAWVDARDVVVDVGCGLGGSSRVLASARGCRVVGIDTDSGRIADARQLTALVGLESLVSFVRADASAPPPVLGFDVLWGQSAWVHVDDKRGFLARWCAALSPSGRVALEDAYLKRTPTTPPERELLRALEQSWHSSLITLDAWQRALQDAGCKPVATLDLTSACMAHFQHLMNVSARWPDGMLTEAERIGWTRALDAGAAGLLGYCRIIANR